MKVTLELVKSSEGGRRDGCSLGTTLDHAGLWRWRPTIDTF